MVDRKLLEAVQELKREYGVSSQNALLYLRTQREYKSLQDKVASGNFRPTLRELSHLCHHSTSFFDEALTQAQLNIGLERGIYDHHLVFGYTDIAPYTSKDKVDTSKEEYWFTLFNFDYEEFIRKHGKAIVDSQDPDNQFRQTSSEVFFSDHPYLAMDYNEASGFFRDLENGRRITFRDFVNIAAREIPKLEPSGLPFPKEVTEREMKRKRSNYLSYLREGEEHPNYSLKRLNVTMPTQEEVTLLYGLGDDSEIDAYDRALEEKTLHKIETERRVAFHAALTNPDFSSDPNFVSKLITSVKEDVSYTSDRISEMDKDPDYQEDAAVLKTEVLDREKYKLRVLRLHKSWLERVLSN